MKLYILSFGRDINSIEQTTWKTGAYMYVYLFICALLFDAASNSFYSVDTYGD